VITTDGQARRVKVAIATSAEMAGGRCAAPLRRQQLGARRLAQEGRGPEVEFVGGATEP
jgi:hypothetical protein